MSLGFKRVLIAPQDQSRHFLSFFKVVLCCLSRFFVVSLVPTTKMKLNACIFNVKEIYKHPDLFQVKLIQQHLAQHGIEAVIMDEYVGALYHGIGTMGPRLMVLDEDFDAALPLISDVQD